MMEISMSESPTGLHVVCVSLIQNVALLSDSRKVPVTHWFDTRGRQCSPKEAVTCVAGSDDVGWFALDLDGLALATIH
jgi:hypothetical protein